MDKDNSSAEISLLMSQISTLNQLLEAYEQTALEQSEKLLQLTGQLKSKIEELERFNKIAVGRELRMIELKKEIAEHKKTAGE